MKPNFKFSIPMTVLIGDINYGNHVGHHHFFLYFQEARVAYLKQLGFSELNINGCGLIISSAECKYKRELFHRDEIRIHCGITELKSKGFNMMYHIVKSKTVCAVGITTNLCFDYGERKVVKLPIEFTRSVKEFEVLH